MKDNMELRKRYLAKAVVVFLFLALYLGFVATGENTKVFASKVQLNTKKTTVISGKSKMLKLSGTKKKVKWSTNNKAIATVTSTGKVTGKATGKAIITAKVGKKKYICKVTVKPFADCTYKTDAGFSFRIPKGWYVKESQEGNQTYLTIQKSKKSAACMKVALTKISGLSTTKAMSDKEFIKLVKSKIKKNTYTKIYSKELKMQLKVKKFTQKSKVGKDATVVNSSYQFTYKGKEAFQMCICDYYKEDYLYEVVATDFKNDPTDMNKILKYFNETITYRK